MVNIINVELPTATFSLLSGIIALVCYWGYEQYWIAQDKKKCFICLEPLGPSTNVKVLPCKHIYHITCLRNLLDKDSLKGYDPKHASLARNSEKEESN